MLDDGNVVKPDVVVYDPSDLDVFEAECTPADRVILAVEVASPAPIHPLHRGRLSTEEPFPLECDLGALVG